MEATPVVFSYTTSEEITNLLSHLPKQVWLEDYCLYQWCGYWYSPAFLEGMLLAQSHFNAHDDDIILTSSIKTGTTWLKSLVPTIINGPQDDDADALTKNNPHAIVNTLEAQTFVQGRIPDLSFMPSPRIFHSHLPFSSLPDSIKKSNCKMVYVARNPKDMFVSLWYSFNSFRKPEQGPYPVDKAFESFCNGVHTYGPYLDHVLEYWKESLISPNKILFLKYEELQKNPNEQVKKLASFLGRPFVSDEEVDNVVRRCSFERLKNLEININGKVEGVPHKSLFRKESVGDWKEIFTVEMEERMDQIVRSKYEGSGLGFEV